MSKYFRVFQVVAPPCYLVFLLTKGKFLLDSNYEPTKFFVCISLVLGLGLLLLGLFGDIKDLRDGKE